MPDVSAVVVTYDAEEYVELVLTCVEQIPPGRVSTYGTIAEVVGEDFECVDRGRRYGDAESEVAFPGRLAGVRGSVAVECLKDTNEELRGSSAAEDCGGALSVGELREGG